MGRNSWLDRREYGTTYYQIFPGQLMVVLVAGSGFARKSTAVKLAKKLMEKLYVRIIPNKLSTEGFLKFLQTVPSPSPIGRIATGAGDGVATIVEDELSVLLSRRTYSEDMIDILTTFYDAPDPFKYFLANKPETTIPKSCITMLGATTPVSLGECIPPRAHSHGFLGRIIFVYSSRTGKSHSLSDVDDEDLNLDEIHEREALHASLLDRLRQIRGITGRITYTHEGRKWFDQWYDKYKTEAEGQGEGWPSRRHDHLSRVAIVLSAAANPNGPIVLDVPYFEVADSYLKIVEANFHKAFACIGQAQNARNMEKILELFRRNGGEMTTAGLKAQMSRYFKDYRELINTIDLLREAGEIVLVGAKPGQKTADEWWRLG